MTQMRQFFIVSYHEWTSFLVDNKNDVTLRGFSFRYTVLDGRHPLTPKNSNRALLIPTVICPMGTQHDTFMNKTTQMRHFLLETQFWVTNFLDFHKMCQITIPAFVRTLNSSPLSTRVTWGIGRRLSGFVAGCWVVWSQWYCWVNYSHFLNSSKPSWYANTFSSVFGNLWTT